MIIRPKHLSAFITLMILAALTIAAGGVIGYHARAYLRIQDSHRNVTSSFNLLRTTLLVDNLSFKDGTDLHGAKLAGGLDISDAGMEEAMRPLVAFAASHDRPRATAIDSLVRDTRNELDVYNVLRVQLSSQRLESETGLAARARLDTSLVKILTMLNVIEQHAGKFLDERRLALERALIAFGLLGFIFLAMLVWQTLRLIRDETDRRLAEEALRDSEATLMSILTAAPTGIGIVSNRIIKWASDELVNMLGYARDEIIGRSARFLYNSREEFQRVGDVKYRLMAEHGVGEIETQWVRKDGSVIDIVLRSSPIDPQNPSTGVTFTALDITATKRTQKALVESEHTVKELFDCMPDGMLLTALDGTILDANPAFITLLGLSFEELIKESLFTLATDRWQQTIHQGLSTVSCIGSAEFEIELTHRDSRHIPVSVSLWSMSNDYGEVTRIGGVIRDITVRRKMEEELVKREKLESVGQLAGGIAHDFNNLLTAILGNISLARIDCKDSHISLQLDDAERATERARSLTQQLLTFSKGGDPIRESISIVELVRESASFVVRGSHSRVVFDFDKSNDPISVDEGQITQVIYNLVINADQAMPNGGTISIRVSPVRIDAVQQPDLHPGNYTCITISDEGCGIPTEQISKIFDPFYTTKPGGSGLGLATTYSIVKKHGGAITVDSTINVGSTFRVFLRNTPVSDDLPTVMQSDFSGGREHGRILLMDDEEVIRQVAGRALTKAGYDVEFAHDGLQAVSSFKRAMREGLRFDVVILDLTIQGGMGGKDTITALRLIDPEVRAIVSSGYSNDPVSANYRDFGFAEAVHKPYKPQQLVEAVLKVIDSGKSAAPNRKPAPRHECSRYYSSRKR